MTADEDGYLYPVNTNAAPHPTYGHPVEGEPLKADEVRALIQKDID